MLRILLPLLMLLLSLSAQGQMYKWVDKDGKTQYTDQPPPPGAAREEKKLNIKSAPTKPASGVGATKSLAEKELEFRKRRTAEGETEIKQQAEAKELKEKCNQATAKLKTFRDSPRLTIPDGAGGVTYADDAARQKGIDEAQKDIAAFCK